MIVCMCDSERACMVVCMIVCMTVCMCDKFNVQKTDHPLSLWPASIQRIRVPSRFCMIGMPIAPLVEGFVAGFATLVHSHWEPPSFNNAHRLRAGLIHGS